MSTSTQRITLDGVAVDAHLNEQGEVVITVAATGPFGPRINAANRWGTGTAVFTANPGTDNAVTTWADIQPVCN
jgi:hypothetical protein